MAYLTKKIEQAHVVWFQASNQWVQMDEQQWLIFSFYKKGIDPLKAAKSVSKRFEIEKKESESVVANIYDSLNNLTKPSFQIPTFSEGRKEVVNYLLKRQKTHTYIFNNKQFSIAYGSPFLEQYIHLPLSHLEVEKAADSELKFELFSLENQYILRSQTKCLSADEPGQIKRLLYIELSNLFYDKNGSSWMSLIHGSAVTINEKLLVLTSPGGSGKSTMAGLLTQSGFDFFSDDYIPVDAGNKKAYPFPALLCIKNNSIELLESRGLELKRNNRGNLAYAVPAYKIPTKSFKISRIVFVQYSKDKILDLKPISTLEALRDFLQEAWVGNDLQRARKFINWFSGLSFYKLEYGNNEVAIEALKERIENP